MAYKDLMITGLERRTAKNKNEYLLLTLTKQDNKEKVWIWDALDKFEEKYSMGDVIGIKADFDSKYPEISSCKKLDYPQEDYMEYEYNSLDKGYEVLNELTGRIRVTDFRELNELVFSDKDILKKFVICIGGLKNHHTKKGGLLRHTKEVMDFVENTAENYPGINTQLALEGALLHDIGKIYEYDMDLVSEPSKSFLSYSTTHLAKGAEILEKKAGGVVPQHKLEHLKHIIHSHHLLEDWGAISEPKTLEAQIVFFGDYFSTQQDRMNKCEFKNGIGQSDNFRGTYLDFNQKRGDF